MTSQLRSNSVSTSNPISDCPQSKPEESLHHHETGSLSYTLSSHIANIPKQNKDLSRRNQMSRVAYYFDGLSFSLRISFKCHSSNVTRTHLLPWFLPDDIGAYAFAVSLKHILISSVSSAHLQPSYNSHIIP